MDAKAFQKTNCLPPRKKLAFIFPDDFKNIYEHTNGFGADLGCAYFEMWSIDSICSSNERLEKDYVFFADDEIDFYAYKKHTGEIFAFSEDNITKCARNLTGFFCYLNTL